MIVAICTAAASSELHLFDKAGKKMESFRWEAGRSLGATLHAQLEALMTKHEKSWEDISGLIVFKGPGSFTGLRIGMSVANALAYSLQAPIVAADGSRWLEDGLDRLKTGENEQIAMPEYGAEANITLPRK